MTRRGAMIGVLLLTVGARLKAQIATATKRRQDLDWTGLQLHEPSAPSDLTLRFGPGGMGRLTVQFSDGQSVTFTENDIQRELLPDPRRVDSRLP